MKTLTKILILLTVASLSIAAAVGVTAILHMKKPVHTQTGVAMRQGHKVIEAVLDGRISLFQALAEMEALSPDLAMTLQNQDIPRLKQIAAEIRKRSKAGFVYFADMRGNILVKTGDPGYTGNDSLEKDLAARASGGVLTATFKNMKDRILSAAIAPVYAGDKPAGLLLVGDNLDSSEMVDLLKNSTHMEVTIFNNDKRAATTITDAQDRRIVGTPLNNAEIADQVLKEGGISNKDNIIAGAPYACVYWPLRDYSQKIIGMGFAGLPTAVAMEQYTRAVRATAGICLVIFILLGLVSLFIAMRLLAPVGVIAAYAGRITRGEEAELTVRRNDDLGELADSLRIMVEKLQENTEKAKEQTENAERMHKQALEAGSEAQKAYLAAENAQKQGMLTAAGQLEEIVTVLAAAAGELSVQIEQVSRGSEEQAARTSEAAAALEEMNSTVFEVAKSATVSADTSAGARAKASEGAGLTEQCISGITEVHSVISHLKEDMAKLSGYAQNINKIMVVISDIADQTNLLALNAAIEAARAGDAGRGFAVVADEIRKLAEKTLSSATDVDAAIRAIQSSSELNSRQVELSMEKVESVTVLAAQCGTALNEIVDMSDSTADQVRAIATASEEQSATSEEITRSVTNVDAIATETSKAMKDAAGAVNKLTGMARQLTDLIQKMKTA